MEEIQLRAEKAYPSDLGRGLIRVSPKVLVEADLNLGDIVEIRGKKKTTAVVAGTKFKDIRKEIARLTTSSSKMQVLQPERR
jgi:Cell division protein 48 (CDC48), N-terminal domain.